MRRLVIVGASLAGLRAAQAARSGGFDGPLIVVGNEAHLPYNRPPLSKQLLQGLQAEEACALTLGTLDVEWLLGVSAVALDRGHKELRLSDGARIPYDRLIVATGCRARPWPGTNAPLRGVLTLRTIDDSLALRSALRSGARLLIVGAGFVGCEVAASARALGVEVVMVDVAPQPMLPLGLALGQRCGWMHVDYGVDLRCNTRVRRLRGVGRVEAVELADGSCVEADVVLVATGALPNTEWLADSGLTLDPGVACDATLTALGDPDILVAGDATSWPHPLADGRNVRVEHWTAAGEQGHLAGRNVLLPPEERKPYLELPYFWSDQYDLKIQSVGFPAAADSLEILESSTTGDRLVAVGNRAGRVTGVIAFNAPKRLAWYRRQLVEAPTIDTIRSLLHADDSALGTPVGAG